MPPLTFIAAEFPSSYLPNFINKWRLLRHISQFVTLKADIDEAGIRLLPFNRFSDGQYWGYMPPGTAAGQDNRHSAFPLHVVFVMRLHR